MSYFFTSESVSEGHPDKVADQISDAIIDNFLAFDPQSKVACETLVTTGQVILAGEVKSSAYLDVQSITREVIQRIGYTKSEYMFEANSCGVFVLAGTAGDGAAAFLAVTVDAGAEAGFDGYRGSQFYESGDIIGNDHGALFSRVCFFWNSNLHESVQ